MIYVYVCVYIYVHIHTYVLGGLIRNIHVCMCFSVCECVYNEHHLPGSPIGRLGAPHSATHASGYVFLSNFGRLTLSYDLMMIVLLLFLQKQNLANAIYLFGLGTLLSGLGLKHMRIRSHHDLAGTLVTPLLLNRPWWSTMSPTCLPLSVHY